MFICFVICRQFYKYTCLLLLFVVIVILFGKNNTLKKTILIFIHLIKVTVLGRALWGANTFPTRNRLPNPYLVRRLFLFLFFLVFLWFSIINCSGDSKSLFNYLKIFKTNFWSPHRDPGCNTDLSPYDIGEDSRSNPFEERGDDKNQELKFNQPQAPAQINNPNDALQIPSGPITRSRA